MFSNLSILFLAATFSLAAATSCQDLCKKFGDYRGCQRLKAGEVDCTYPAPIVRQKHKASGAAPVKAAKAEHIERFHTRWEGGREKKRFAITLSDKSLAIDGEALPPLDPYYLHFSPRFIQGDHLIDIESSCRPGLQGRRLCDHDRTGNYTQATVIFKKTGPRAFDFKLFGRSRGQTPASPQTLQFHAASDGKYLLLEYYRDGYLLPDLTERHPLAP
ncbi:hypothetical protein [Nitratifractor salsuginis]|uniref:hypothetical protein n=1 Tax=Nitratifractor salsuginis TaxID=269261 RepID=UPI00031AF69E|nr:hypothetical protein [Nitratifractor salsuginis]